MNQSIENQESLRTQESSLFRNKFLATSAAALSMMGVGGTVMHSPEKADAASELCTTPLNQQPVSTPKISEQDILSVDKPAMSNRACVGMETTFTTYIRSYTNQQRSVGFGVKGTMDVMKSISSIAIDGEVLPIQPWTINTQGDGSKFCALREDSTSTDRNNKPSKSIDCGGYYYEFLEPGQAKKIEVKINPTIPSNIDSNSYISIGATTKYPSTYEFSAASNNVRDYDFNIGTNNGEFAGPDKGVDYYVDGKFTPPSTISTCNKPSVTVKRRLDGRYNVKIIPKNKVLSKYDGASKLSSTRSKAARVKIPVPVGTKVPPSLPANMRKIGSSIFVDLRKDISANKTWKFITPFKTSNSKKLSAVFYAPKGTIKGCESKGIVIGVRSTKAR